MKRLPVSPTSALSLFILVLFAAVVTLGAFIAGVWAMAGIGGALILFLSVAGIERRWPLPPRNEMIFVGIVLAAIAVLNLQSWQPALSWHVWLQVVTILVPLMLLSSPALQARLETQTFISVLFVGAICGALALGIELSLGGPMLHAVKGATVRLTHYNRGLSYLVILAFPIMAGLLYGPVPVAQNKRVWLVIVFIIVLLFPAGLTESRAAKLALLMGLPATMLMYFLPIVTRSALTLLPFALLSWPLAVQNFFLKHYEWLQHFPDSWRARMEIWDYMSYRIMERPWLGWGFGTAHTLPMMDPHGAQYVFIDNPAAHPHNVVTQLWVELGIPGLILGIVFALSTLRKAVRLNRKLAPFAVGAWVAALCLSLVAYNFWTDSLFAAFALTGLVFAMLEKKQPKKTLGKTDI